MYELITELNKEGMTIIQITHDIEAALRYASHILHIGDSVFFGTGEEYAGSGEGKAFLGMHASVNGKKVLSVKRGETHG